MLQRYTKLPPGKPLARHTGFGPRRQPLARESAAHRRGRRQQAAAYREAAKVEFCEVCGVTGQHLDHSHHFTQKAYPEYANNPLNYELHCRACHECWENHKAEFAAKWPGAWRRILARMRQIDYRAYCFFRMKHSH